MAKKEKKVKVRKRQFKKEMEKVTELKHRREQKSPTTDDVHRWRGISMEVAEITEEVIKFTAVMIIQRKKNTPYDIISNKFDDAPMGKSITAIRQKFDLDPDFKQKLEDFLEIRNIIAHKLRKYSDFNIDTKEGRYNRVMYLKSFFSLCHDVLAIFSALVHEWKRIKGYPVSMPGHQYTKQIIGIPIEEVNKCFGTNWLPEKIEDHLILRIHNQKPVDPDKSGRNQ